MRWGLGVTAAFVVCAGAPVALAASETPVYAPAPEWVKAAPAIDVAGLYNNSPVVLLMDQQHRFGDGQVTVYSDSAIRMASTQIVNQAGTITLPWQPHHGDLVIHRAEILRGGDRIDLLAKGERFTVLRREEQLEQLQMSGVLTATMTVEDLRVGDVLRMTTSVTIKDAALGGHAQTIAPMISHPVRADFARTRLIWPKDLPLAWRSLAPGVEVEPVTSGAFRELEVMGTLEESDELPNDTPMRYRPLPLIEATTFADWPAVSRTMAPHYATDGLIAPNGPIAAEIAKIRAATNDPRTRAARALRVVQDDIRYMFNGMEGGNYVPQSPAKTWSLRYGDCKAKTLLLLAMLRALDVEAEPVLVNSQMGDLVPKRLPSAAAFDHVIVRAVVDGESLWLDGTGSGDRLADIGDTPGFRHVLPLRADGADLMPLEMHAPARPEVATMLELDQRAGIDFPAPFKITMRFRGAGAQHLQQLALQGDSDQVDQVAATLIRQYTSVGTVYAETVDYDADSGTAILSARGITYPGWQRKGSERQIAIEYVLPNLNFAPDRSRSAWRDIPVATDAPSHLSIITRTQMPEGVRLAGAADHEATLGGVAIARHAKIENGILTLEERRTTSGAEIAPGDVAAARQALSRSKGQWLYAASTDPAPIWHQIETGRKDGRFDAILAGYAQDIEESPDESAPLAQRAWFKSRILDHAGAVADLSRAIEIDGNAAHLLRRAGAYRMLGNDEAALADMEAAHALDSSIAATHALATMKGELGDHQAALDLIEGRVSTSDDEGLDFLSLKATLLAESGAVDEAIGTLDSGVDANPRNAMLLNNRCWLKATMNVALDSALADCTRSIELAESPAAALDSRALVHFRLGRMEAALADLKAALDISPDMPAAIYLRGIVRSHQQDRAAAEDIKAATMMAPRIAEEYDRWGVKPKG